MIMIVILVVIGALGMIEKRTEEYEANSREPLSARIANDSTEPGRFIFCDVYYPCG